MTSEFVPLEFERLSGEESEERARRFYGLMARRRSVRHFAGEEVPAGVIDAAIETASTAPSGAHLQPWHFVVVRDPEVKRRIREAAEEEERENYERRFPEEWKEELAKFGTSAEKPNLEEAPVLIAVFAERTPPAGSERRKNYYVTESVGLATGLLIAALHNAGLATLTHTPNPMGFIREILGRPSNETPFVLMPVGYPAEGAQVPALVRKPLDEVRTWVG